MTDFESLCLDERILIPSVKTKLQVQARVDAGTDAENEYYSGTWDCIAKIYEKEGITGLYTGMPGNLIGTASTNFAYFYWYGVIRGGYVKRYGSNINTANELLLGAVAAAVSQLFTIPISVVTTRQQTDESKKGLIATTSDVITDDGITGLWRGLKASLVLVVNPSITYGSFERLKSLIYPGKAVLSSSQNFLLGALSKAMATIVTQPMIVAKVMQQSSSKKKKQHFDSFVAALTYLLKHEGFFGMWKGLGPQISKGVLVQGLLFTFKDQVELFLILFTRLIKRRLAIVSPV